jgi:hypothetical protein
MTGTLAPQQQADGTLGWALPLDPDVRCIHMGDVRELGNIVAGHSHARIGPDMTSICPSSAIS